jgi:hypothetical protein
MPTAATVTQGGTAQGTRARGQQAPVMPVVPFVRASAEHREPAGVDTARLSTGSDQDLGVFDVPAYGYVRSIVILVNATGAVGAATAGEDSPFSVIKNIALTEPNGAVIHQFSSGYNLYLANKWGGYRDSIGADARQSPVYTAPGATGNFSFLLRIPVEINLRDALGALPNQNAAATFKVRLTMAANLGFTTPPATTQPSVRVRLYAECWDQPSTSDGGQTNQVTPPAMNTTQFWSEQSYNYNAGQQTIRLTRIGNYVRNLVLVARRTASTRANGDLDFPDPVTVLLDARPLDILERNNFKNQMFERTGFGGTVGTTTPAADAPGGLDAGVFVYDFTHEFDGTLGRETRDLWLPTLPSSRLELQGSFASAGTLTVLTNDVAIAGGVFL